MSVKTVDGLRSICKNSSLYSSLTVSRSDCKELTKMIERLNAFVVEMHPSLRAASSKKEKEKPRKVGAEEASGSKELKRRSSKFSLFRGVRALVSKKKSR